MTAQEAPARRAWHAVPAEDALRATGSGRAAGLAWDTAAQRLAEHGPNSLPEGKQRSLAAMFFHQFASPLIYVLFAAAVIAFAMSKRSDAFVILLVVVVNAVIGMVQEGRAERSMSALRKLSAVKVRLRRDGREESVDASELVPGDIILLNAGDAVAADARLLEAAALQVAEAALTGESLPVAKAPAALPEDTALADRANMLYSGTHISAGRGEAVVVETGLRTEIGKIATLTAGAVEGKTPLEKRIAAFGRLVVFAAIGMVAIVLAIGWARGLPFVDVFMVAVSQMVSMVPEGLPVAMTIALAVGMQRMASRKAIVRRLSAVETLGSTTVICSDKTGTLTRNEMTVTAVWLPDGRAVKVSGIGYQPEGGLRLGEETLGGEDPGIMRLAEAVALCNDAQLVPPDEEETRWRPLGDPTEASLLTFAAKAGVILAELRDAWPRRAEIPFDSAAKMMATQHERNSSTRIFIKGAPEVLLPLCGKARQGESSADFGDALREEAEAAAGQMAREALRLLAIAEVDDGSIAPAAGFDQFQGKLTLLGLLGQMDPPRDEVKASVAECLAAGVRPVMVTGDHKITGLAIARQLGIAGEGDIAVDGGELERMSDADLREKIDRITVFARVHPEQKLRIVGAFQAKKEVVAMTGDGVNDAPALAKADVGVAMGITGTEVAKGAAKIVISDDNFASIVSAIEEGRLVYRNLKKVVLYLFATSMAEIAVLLSALFLGYPMPLAAVQILWINLVTEGTVTVNLIMDPPEGDEMKRPPVPQDEGLITRPMLQRILVMTPVMAICTFGYFAWRIETGAPFAQAQTESFTVLAVCQWFNVLNCRSETRSALNLGFLKNKWLLGGLLLGNFLHFLVIYTPGLNAIFHTVPIGLGSFLLIGAVASSVLWAEEARKWLARQKARARGK